MAIDTDKLHAILAAAQNPAFKKLIDERTKKLEERAKIDAEVVELDEKIANTIPPELLVLLTPPKSAGAGLPRKRKTSGEEPQPEKPAAVEEPAAEVKLPAEEKPKSEVKPPAEEKPKAEVKPQTEAVAAAA